MSNQEHINANDLIPNGIKWLKFARSIGATHWNEKHKWFYKYGEVYADGNWVKSKFLEVPMNPENGYLLIDFSPIDNKPS